MPKPPKKVLLSKQELGTRLRAIRQQRPYHVALERGGVAVVEDGEARAVEAREAGLRGQPEIAVVGLRDGVDRELREALVPHVLAVLRDGQARIERMGIAGPGHQRSEEREPYGPGHASMVPGRRLRVKRGPGM